MITLPWSHVIYRIWIQTPDLILSTIALQQEGCQSFLLLILFINLSLFSVREARLMVPDLKSTHFYYYKYLSLFNFQGALEIKELRLL